MKRIIFLLQSIIFISLACVTYGQNKIFNIADYGAIGNGKISCTKLIQKAVNECNKQGGGTIVFPPGKFLTGSIQLFSNMQVYLSPGAVVAGVEDNDEYLQQKDFGFTGMGAGNKTGIFFAVNAENISIKGEGIIDGQGNFSVYLDSLQHGSDMDYKYTRQGKDYMNPEYGMEDGPVLWKGTYEQRPGVMLIFSSCKNISINDIVFKESPNWTMAFQSCDDVKINGISIFNNMSIPNSDGMDFYDTKNSAVSNCVIHAGDDAIALIGSENITVSNCVLHSRSAGVRIGYNVFNERNSGNLIFNNLRMYDCNRGIGIFQRMKGNIENIIFSNIIIQTRLHTGQWWGHGEPIHISAVPGIGSKEVGEIKNIQFNNIIATGEEGIVVYGSNESVLKDISFNNVQLTLKKGKLTENYGGNFDLRPTNDIAVGIFKHDIPALYATHIEGLRIKDFQVKEDGQLPSFFTYAVQCDHFKGLFIDGVTGSSFDKKLPLIHLKDGRNATVKNISEGQVVYPSDKIY